MVPFLGNIREFSGFFSVQFLGVLEVVEKNPKNLVRFGFGRVAVRAFHSFRWCPNGREELRVSETTTVFVLLLV